MTDNSTSKEDHSFDTLHTDSKEDRHKLSERKKPESYQPGSSSSTFSMKHVMRSTKGKHSNGKQVGTSRNEAKLNKEIEMLTTQVRTSLFNTLLYS